MTKKKKINWLIILQGWAMLWVVIGHSTVGVAGEGPIWENTLFHFAYSFHMPLFMLISGWLFYRTRLDANTWSYNQIVKDKAIRLLLPGLVFSIVAFVLKMAFPGEMSRQMDINLQGIVHQYMYPNDNPMRELWFIATLFWLFLLTPLWKIVLNRPWSMWLTVVILLVLHFCYLEIELLCIGRVFNFAIWFYLGLVISKTEIVEKSSTNNVWLIILIGIAIYAIGMITDGFVVTLGGIIFSFGLALFFDRCLPNIFYTFRNYTYQIFLIGIFAQILVKIIYRHISMPYFVAYLLCIAAGLYVPVIVSKIIEKTNYHPLLLCVGLKKK